MTRFACVVPAAFLVVSCTSTDASFATSYGPAPARAAREAEGDVVGKIAQEDVSREGESTVVVLSVGAKDGVKVGYRFTVYRGEDYVGKVEVIKVMDDMSFARVLDDWTRKEIRANDDASTRVY